MRGEVVRLESLSADEVLSETVNRNVLSRNVRTQFFNNLDVRKNFLKIDGKYLVVTNY